MLILIFSFIAYAIVGVLAGILAGLLGIGGGVITVPFLLMIFTLMDFPQAYIMHLAIGTSLASMALNTLSSTWAHHQRKAVLWRVVKIILPGLVIGSILGAVIADFLSGVILEMFFGVFAILLGIYLYFRKHEPHQGSHRLPNAAILNTVGAGIGGISNILGIGGGIMTMPILMAYKVHEKNAIATSSAISFFVTLIGAISYLYVGLDEISFHHTLGFIYIPAFLIVGAFSFLAAPYGAKITHDLSPILLRKTFALALILAGMVMLFK